MQTTQVFAPAKINLSLKILSRRVDGVVFMSHSDLYEYKHLEELPKNGIPLVVINRYFEHSKIHRIWINHLGAAREQMKHLIDSGHRRIAFVGESPKMRTQANIERLKAYRALAEENGISTHGLERFADVADVGSGVAAARELLSRGKTKRPTAFLAGNDYQAVGIIRAAREAGLRIPHDVAVIGNDNLPQSLTSEPPISTAAQPLADAGRLAIEILLRQINKPIGRAEFHLLDCAIIHRESCCVQKVGDK